MSFASSATAAGGANGASDKILTSGVEAFVKPGKGKGGGAGKGKGGSKGGKGGQTDGDDPVDPSPWICHWAGDRYLLIEPNDSSHTGGDYNGPGHDLHDGDVIVAPGGSCELLPNPDTGVCPVSTDIVNDEGLCEAPATGGDTDGDNDGDGDNTDGGEGDNDDTDGGDGDGPGNDNDGGEGDGGEGDGGDGGDGEGPGGTDGPGGKDPVTDPVESPDEGGTPVKPGKDNDGRPNKPGKDDDGKPGVKPIIKPGDKTPIVKGVDKEVPKPGTVVKPVAGNPVTQPQTGSTPQGGTPGTLAPAETAPGKGKKNRPGANVLPNTGLEDHLGLLTAGGLALLLTGGVLVAPRRRPVRVAR